MADLLTTSISGLLAFQRALDTTSHNITNVEHGRLQPSARPEFDDASGAAVRQRLGRARRRTSARSSASYDDFLASQTRTSSSSLRAARHLRDQAERAQQHVRRLDERPEPRRCRSSSTRCRASPNTPTSIPARQVLLSEAQDACSSACKFYDSRLDEHRQRGECAAQGRSGRDQLDRAGHRAAEQRDHGRLSLAPAGSRRTTCSISATACSTSLSQKISVNVVEQDGGTGQRIHRQRPAARARRGRRTSSRRRRIRSIRRGSSIALQTPGGSVDITRNISGGALGGMLDFRSEQLDPARNALGRISVALTEVVNAQHRAGMDLTGALGGDFFAVGGARRARQCD